MDTFQSMYERLKLNVSRLEGSFATDNLRAVACELDRAWDMGINYMPWRFFPSLASGGDLTRAAANWGVDRKQAAKAKVTLAVTGEPGAAIDENVRACASSLAYAVLERKEVPESGVCDCLAEAVEGGSAYNVPAGEINEFASHYEGLYSVVNPSAADGGADAETDADLRERVALRWKLPSTGGNIADYMRWALEVPGVSRVRVLNPRGGDVDVYLMAATGDEAGDALIADVSAAIERIRPVGARVTVRSAKAVGIRVEAALVLMPGYTLGAVANEIVRGVDDYLAQSALASRQVSFMRIAELMFVPGVDDVVTLKLNGGAQSVPLGLTEFGRLLEAVIS